VADLKTHQLRHRLPGQDPDGRSRDGTGPGGPGRPGGLDGLKSSLRGAAMAVTPRALWRGHRLFTVLVLLSLLPRILASLAFRPALLTADSFLYMQNAVNGKLGNIRPAGYSFFLSIFQGVPHTLLAVTTVQHLLGVAVAIIVYSLLRYWGLPGWGAALATVPTLFDPREIALESYILPDTVFCFVILLVVALLLTKRTPRLWQCVVAGLLLAYASVLRGNGIPLVVIVAAFLLIRKVGWKAFAAGSLAFVIPVLAYVAAFHSQYGAFNLTQSDGIFLWSRTTSFANCAVIKPPPDLRPLCPNLEKSVAVPPARSWSMQHLLNEPSPSSYLWAHDVWWRVDAHPGIDAYNNKLGERFAIRAIEAQPLDYLRVVGRDIAETFLTTDRPQSTSNLGFTSRPRIPSLPSYYQQDLKAYAGTTANTHPVAPYSFFMLLYQQPVIFPGLVFLLLVLAGLVGVVRNWRRWGGIQALPWALAAVSLVSPALLTQSLYRYAVVAIPLACLAAGLSFARLVPGRRLGFAPASGPALAGAAGPALAGGPDPAAEPEVADGSVNSAESAGPADSVNAADSARPADSVSPADSAGTEPARPADAAARADSADAGSADKPPLA